ncbi:MAG: SGNH/GDSL hydrolase family protein [Deltaproteobacteria bacterium]
MSYRYLATLYLATLRIALPAGALLVFGCGEDAADNSTAIGQARGATYASWTAPSQDPLELLPFPGVPAPVLQRLDNQTLRQILRISAGGQQLRVRFSNRFGPTPITFDRAAVALSAGGAAIDAASQLPLTFAGSARVTVAVGQEVWSDFVDLSTRNEQDLAVTVYSAGPSAMGTSHSLGRQTTYITAGDAVDAATLPTPESPPTSYYWLNAIEVSGERQRRVVVAFGDSITDGFNSTLDANHRYPNYLSALLTGASAPEPFSVVNAGISGNRVLNDIVGPSGVSRFAHDALQPLGVRDVVILLGINDFGIPVFLGAQDVSAQQIMAGLGGLVSAAKAQGLRVYLSTLLPFEGAGYFTEEGESKRVAVNAWVRSNPDVAAVIDFDQLMADPSAPRTMVPKFDSGDHLHPKDDGYEAMAAAVQSKLDE